MSNRWEDNTATPFLGHEQHVSQPEVDTTASTARGAATEELPEESVLDVTSSHLNF